jgi:class 3 adenylate cyclase
VIGDTVNTAARFQDAATENQILISEQCYEHVKESFQCKKLDPIKMKNKTEAIVVYEVLE